MVGAEQIWKLMELIPGMFKCKGPGSLAPTRRERWSSLLGLILRCSLLQRTGKAGKIRTLRANITRQLQGQDLSTTMHQPKSSSCSPHFRNHVDKHCCGPLEEFGNIFLAQPQAGTHRLRGHFLLTPDFTLIVPSQQPLIKRLPLAFLLKINLIK